MKSVELIDAIEKRDIMRDSLVMSRVLACILAVVCVFQIAAFIYICIFITDFEVILIGVLAVLANVLSLIFIIKSIIYSKGELAKVEEKIKSLKGEK